MDVAENALDTATRETPLTLLLKSPQKNAAAASGVQTPTNTPASSSLTALTPLLPPPPVLDTRPTITIQ